MGYTTINTQLNNLISTKISPLTASINEKYKDYPISGEKLAKILLQRLTVQGKDTGLFTHDKGFYVVHKLKEKFDTETTEVLLKSVKAAILIVTYNKFRISSMISDDLLRVDAEIIPSDNLYVI